MTRPGDAATEDAVSVEAGLEIYDCIESSDTAGEIDLEGVRKRKLGSENWRHVTYTCSTSEQQKL